jgi:WD40 repeat protein
MALSQDELLLATASLDNTISLWDPKTNRSVGRPLDHRNGLRCAAFGRNSRLLATSVDKSVFIWDLQMLFRDVNVNFQITLPLKVINDTLVFTRLQTANQDRRWERLQLVTH